MQAYEIFEHGEYKLTVEAKNGQQAKRIYCRLMGISPSDKWCGMSVLSAKLKQLNGGNKDDTYKTTSH